ncbi:hypothetical protein HC928_04500 [bacterium]|nr:hypothetical protein [bacterium]
MRKTSGYSDTPISTLPSDKLGFRPSVTALKAILSETEIEDTPFIVGIYGAWGSGKTSMMQMLLSELDPNECIPIWFDAWRYTQQDALWRALLVCVIEGIREAYKHDEKLHQAYVKPLATINPADLPRLIQEDRQLLKNALDDLLASLYRTVDREELGEMQFQLDEAGKLALSTVLRLSFNALPLIGILPQAVQTMTDEANKAVGQTDFVGKLLEREKTRIYRDQVQSLEQFYKGFEELVTERITNLKLRLVVFIDDLDRCLPEQAISVLEALKAFLDVQGCIFVLGVDREIIERGIRVRYKEFALAGEIGTRLFPVAGRDYLEKIVQIPFELPPLEPETIQQFLTGRLTTDVENLCSEPIYPDNFHRQGDTPTETNARYLAKVMTAGLSRNPRKVKRTLNTFRVLLRLDRAHKQKTNAVLIAKLVVLQSSFPELYELVSADPNLLKDIERMVRGLPDAHTVAAAVRERVPSSSGRLSEMFVLKPFFTECSERELRQLVYRSRVTGERGAGATEGSLSGD